MLAVWVWHYIDTKDFRDEKIPIEVVVGQTFDMKFKGTPPIMPYPCWLDIPDGITLVERKHTEGLYERLHYSGAGDGTDMYTFKAVKEGRYKLIRGNCLGDSPVGGWEEEIKELDSTVTNVYTITVTQ